MSDSLKSYRLQPTRLLCPWDPQERLLNGLPFPFPGDLPNPGIEHMSPAAPALAGGFFTVEPPGKPTKAF